MLRSRRLGPITSPVFQVEKEISATSGDPMERGGEARAAAASLPVSRAVYALAIAAVALHMAFSGRYGYFRDELYYAACGQRLAWGYVDHAPLAPFLARVSRALLGDSLSALRLLPALAASAKVATSARRPILSGTRQTTSLRTPLVRFSPLAANSRSAPVGSKSCVRARAWL